MATPLLDELRAQAEARPLRLDMPGHHGKPLAGGFPWPSELDFTENGRTGDLFGGEPDGIQRAEALWAARLGFDSCLFLTGGSTQGIHTGLALLAGAGGAAAIDRGSHRSVYHALALLDLSPAFLTRPWLAEEGITGPILPETVAEVLSARRSIKTVCITSPTYYGVLSDIPAIAAVCHAHGAKLMVDGAHGAHLPFLGDEGYRAADVVVMSAHKTLPAPGQSALLFANGFPLSELQRWGSVYGSSSPSYVFMAALDAVRDYMEGEGTARYRETVRLVGELPSPARTASPWRTPSGSGGSTPSWRTGAMWCASAPAPTAPRSWRGWRRAWREPGALGPAPPRRLRRRCRRRSSPPGRPCLPPGGGRFWRTARGRSRPARSRPTPPACP